MNWPDFKEAISQAIAQRGIDPFKVDIWYFDIRSELNHSIFQYELHIEPTGDGRYRLWMD